MRKPSEEPTMKYLLIISNDWIPASDVEEALIGETIGPFVAEIQDQHIFGHPLQSPETASTVRVRKGETLVTDGPFVEAKEGIAGFSVLECESQEQAIEIAARHPMAWFNPIEVRPLMESDGWTDEVRNRLEAGPPAGKDRYLLMIHSDGVATPEKRETMQRELPGYVDRILAEGTYVAGNQLATPATAVTVRVRGPHTLLTDGPFIESKEFLAGFDVIDCASREEAIAVAAAHPVSWFHAIEVRPFTPLYCGEEADMGVTEASAA
jgi:hypothetical protein